MAKVGVVLAGSGVFDGSEIHEAVFTLLALDRAGAEAVIVAPEQEHEVVDHYAGRPTGERRNVLVEAARIARGKIKPLRELRADEVDAVVLPGGFGAAKNLSDFATRGGDATAIPELASLLREVHEAGKPICALCIAPAILAAVFGGEFRPKLTIGTDAATAAGLEKLGAEHVDCAVDGVVVDEARKLVTSPAYMLAQRIGEVETGIARAVAETLRLAGA